jgi:hypothetical protein
MYAIEQASRDAPSQRPSADIERTYSKQAAMLRETTAGFIFAISAILA